jgi:hypothetical protein
MVQYRDGGIWRRCDCELHTLYNETKLASITSSKITLGRACAVYRKATDAQKIPICKNKLKKKGEDQNQDCLMKFMEKQRSWRQKSGEEVLAEGSGGNANWKPGLLTFRGLAATLCTRFNIKKFYVVPTLRLCVLYGSQNKQQLLPYKTVKRLVLITEVESVYSAVRSESLYKTDTLRL